jgi:hypothetical protein
MRKGSSRVDEWKGSVPLDSIPIQDSDLRGNTAVSVINGLVVFTRIAGFLLLCSQLYLLAHPCGDHEVRSISFDFTFREFLTTIVSLYECYFAVVLIGLDTEVRFMGSANSFLESYFVRGSFIMFLGALSTLLTDSCVGVEEEMAVKILEMANVIAVSLVGIGGAYITAACCCVKHIKDQSLAALRKKKQALLQEQKLRLHKSEVEQLLMETERKVQML